MTTSAKLALFSKELTSRGIAFETLGDTGHEFLTFRYRDLQFLLPAEASDPKFFLMILPGIYRATETEDKQRALAIANELNRQRKVVKAQVAEGGEVSLAIEMFLDPIETFRPVFERSLQCLFETWILFGARVMGHQVAAAA
ncbi:MAG: hypothetical protein IPK26_20465 [Planctomycetes bacterium]|nr:hypothetical protein [Planctomycetota bacterium]